MNITHVKQLYFKLMVEAFANHCFGCSEWGYLMVECQHYPSLPMGISNEGIVNEDVGRDVETSNNVIVRDEATSFEIGDKDA